MFSVCDTIYFISFIKIFNYNNNYNNNKGSSDRDGYNNNNNVHIIINIYYYLIKTFDYKIKLESIELEYNNLII